MGPSGVGKTFIAAGLAYDAIKAGYDALFRNHATGTGHTQAEGNDS